MRMPPRQPRNTVGRSAASRGPSEPTNTSADNSSRSDSQTAPRSGEPVSSPISTMNLALKPSLPPRVSRTARSAARLMLGQKKRRLSARGLDQAGGEVELGEGGRQLLFQIGAQDTGPLGIQTLRLEADPAVELLQEYAG